MTTRTRSLAALAAGAAVLAVPAVASASGPTVVAGPIKAKGYKLTLTATNGSLGLMLDRASGRAHQMHSYSFSQGVKVKASKDLRTATVKASLGRYGAVKLKLTGAAALKRGKVPAGCTGSAGKGRAGTLRGKLSFAADGGSYFGTIKAKSLKGQVLKAGKLSCSGGTTGGDQAKGTVLSRIRQTPAGMVMLSVVRSGGAVTQQVMRTDDAASSAPASVFHMITAPASAGSFTTETDLSSARVTGASPFLSGTLAFTADSVFSGIATGTASGDLAARFDSIGALSLTEGSEPASVSNR
jgi:hypothetical protein